MTEAKAPVKAVNAISLLQGAAVMLVMAKNMEDAAARSKDSFMRLRKTDIAGLVNTLRMSANMVDLLVCAIERGERFDEKLPR